MPASSHQYPIGKFEPRETYTPQEITAFLLNIKLLPSKIEALYRQFKPAQLDLTYREDGWTARQIIHHLADSHMNAYIRTKWTLTEDTPLIKAYDEKNWAKTPDVQTDPVVSIELLHVLHKKWVSLLRTLKPSDLERSFIHPETKKHIRLDRLIALYAWHGEHHLAHLALILDRRL
ncbi:MAG: putative metal-dependent hydrolase [Flammeovirgaceae bacterium]|nr:MAG: putative metal-dependent hydrolase [Flammeovirgaceae bacterium]